MLRQRLKTIAMGGLGLCLSAISTLTMGQPLTAVLAQVGVSESTHIFHYGDINGDGLGDIFLQARPAVATIDAGYIYTVGAVKTPHRFAGLVVLQQNTNNYRISAAWSNGYLGIRHWTSADSTLRLTDINGDGRNDIQLVTTAGDTHVLYSQLGSFNSPNSQPFTYFVQNGSCVISLCDNNGCYTDKVGHGPCPPGLFSTK